MVRSDQFVVSRRARSVVAWQTVLVAPTRVTVETVESAMIVLQARPYRETSLLLEVLTEQEGRISLVARGMGAAKTAGRMRAALAPLALSQAQFRIRSGAEIGQLHQVEVLESWEGFRGDLERYAWASFMVEATARAVDARQPCGPVFDAVLTGLRLLHDRSQSLHQELLVGLMERLAGRLGLGLGLGACQHCGRVEELVFAAALGQHAGALCDRCALPGGDYVPMMARRVVPVQDRTVQAQGVRALSLVVPDLWRRQLGRELQSGQLLRSVYGLMERDEKK